jgi:hypothetical protein
MGIRRRALLQIILMASILALQEALTFEEEGNKTIHYFSDTETLSECEGGFYNAEQILTLKDKKLDWIWILMVLLVVEYCLIYISV